MSEPTTEPQQQPEPNPNAPAEAAPKGKPGETPEQTIAGLRDALAKANKEAEQSRVKARDEFRTQMRELFGEQPEGTKPEDAVRGLQQRMQQMEHELRLSETARAFGITDETDLTLLRAAESPEVLTALAQRLKPAAPADPPAPRNPRPDLTQALGGTTTTAQTPAEQFAEILNQSRR
jgi:uncharacterized membrane protein YccC